MHKNTLKKIDNDIITIQQRVASARQGHHRSTLGKPGDSREKEISNNTKKLRSSSNIH